ncbi:MBL fold metallo-hydrolase [Pedobacter psychrophilus]|uniref:MBL fold metallo-hydrolase n=1 Tax=Pedobacter psychrophilus TaxID=1826909 RepID=A0A179DB89_9SPHI|nr:rhodanese-like domain-containing protein [Pedobacter psychrophilus]OAQ38297.1 MBL fold metallo-hydrolase [Pedobacter psychrophilus]
MKIEQIYTGCLAQGAYYIESDGEAAIVDPLRETAPYIEKAKQNNVKIKYVFETHFHADFVSGHVDLAQKTGAEIVYGPTAETGFDAHIAKDNEEFKVGKIIIKALHTPGHTPESTTYLCLDENEKPYCIFTGDTLFIGDVGRPDLAQKSTETTPEAMAAALYDSLREKIMPLPNDVIVYPAHGAGSACGKNMSKETFDTLGNQKETNYALSDISKSDFIKELTTNILPPPQYFPKNAKMNKEGIDTMDEVFERGLNALSPDEFELAANTTGALILDVRSPEDFSNGFIPNAIFIGLDGSFAPWVGALVTDLKQPLLLVVEDGREEETVKRLARVGYDFTMGYLKGGMLAWKKAGKEIDKVKTISADELKNLKDKKNLQVFDVRKPSEFEAEHLKITENQPLDFINDWTNNFDKQKPYYLHCAGGYRSMISSSILKARGFEDIINVNGGFAALKDAGFETVGNH